MPNARAEFKAIYLIESPEPVQKAAEIVAGEQSSGTFLELPGETEELKARARARVTRLNVLPPAMEPTLASAWAERRGHRGPWPRARRLLSALRFSHVHLGG